MTDRQRRFCEEYLVDLNATQAAIRAGYARASAGSIAAENMKKPAVRALIDEAMAARAARTGISAERVMCGLSRIAFYEEADADQSGGDAREAQAGSPARKSSRSSAAAGEVRTADRLRALELLGRHLGMWSDKMPADGGATVQIVDDIGADTGFAGDGAACARAGACDTEKGSACAENDGGGDGAAE